jgi:ATP-dependent RNA helicase RhlE
MNTTSNAPGGAHTLVGAFTQLHESLQRGIRAAGYTTPTPIQEQSIPPILEGRDLIGTAQTGTGKTAAFVLPMLQRLEGGPPPRKFPSPRALILAPTRELAGQIGDSIGTYGKGSSLRHTVIFGGVSQFHQEKALRRGVDILVATPGRLLDLLNQDILSLKAVEIFVLDEMDRMLDMGFLPDIKRLMQKIPAKRHTLFFSATMSGPIEKIAMGMVQNPVRVAIDPGEPTVDRINQTVNFMEKGHKLSRLIDLLGHQDTGRVMVFTQMKHSANKVVDRLNQAGIQSAAIHGNKSQGARTRALDGFKSGKVKALVATDVAARGLDVDEVTHVINFDMPVEAETYVHRIGRTARAGASGDAVSFCSPEDRAYLTAVEKLIDREVPVDLDHPYHSDEARYSKLKPKVPGRGRQGSGGKNRGRSRSSAGRGRRR